ncbi:MAG TPA: 3-hydroxybutyryl-CoA dehydrogenase [Gemmatimonadaceae bacterium]|nr:3-hydroxybutyryl-CoA dehydrogenase [Gemmatimonadaceae bacterium]
MTVVVGTPHERQDAGAPPITTVGIVGGGSIGTGVAEVVARAGFATVVRELTESLAANAKRAVERSLARAVERGRATAAERDAALARLDYTAQITDLVECDLVIEAVSEDLATKRTLWTELDAFCAPHTVFASTTSSLAIAVMAAATARPDRMVGLHFFQPVPVMPLVEVVRTVTTSETTFRTALEFARRLGKEPIVAKDRPGFVVNRLLIPYLLDAIHALESGVASVADIDRGMHLGAGHPMGPFTLLDFLGLDTACTIAQVMYEELGDRRFAPPPLLKRMVQAGLFGRKSGKGFYDYTVEPPRVSELGL